MSRIIEGTYRTRIVEPAEAAQYDPSLAEYLALPISDCCPADETHQRWGTRNPSGYLPVRYCAECRANFRPAPSAYMIAELARALTGLPQRFAC